MKHLIPNLTEEHLNPEPNEIDYDSAHFVLSATAELQLSCTDPEDGVAAFTLHISDDGRGLEEEIEFDDAISAHILASIANGVSVGLMLEMPLEEIIERAVAAHGKLVTRDGPDKEHVTLEFVADLPGRLYENAVTVPKERIDPFVAQWLDQEEAA